MALIRSISMVLAATMGASLCAAQSPESKAAQRLFPTPEAAAKALIEACRDNDSPALVAMLGEAYGAEIAKIDDAEEAQHRREFYAQAQALTKIEPQGDARAVLIIGTQRWPVPAPLVKEEGGWRFDSAEGMEELRARRIGENELAAMEACHEFVRAQAEYAAVDRDGDEVREYAQRILSTEGKRDGLYWEADPASRERPSPLAAFLPDQIDGLRRSNARIPYMGYYFKVLTRQGEGVPGGKYDYVINGNMIAGYGLVAWPAEYRFSGVMTFVISHQGKLYEKDLGADTAKVVEAMNEYNVDDTWKPAKP